MRKACALKKSARLGENQEFWKGLGLSDLLFQPLLRLGDEFIESATVNGQPIAQIDPSILAVVRRGKQRIAGQEIIDQWVYLAQMRMARGSR